MINYEKLDPLSKTFYNMFTTMGCSQDSIEEFVLSYRSDEKYAFSQLEEGNPSIDVYFDPTEDGEKDINKKPEDLQKMNDDTEIIDDDVDDDPFGFNEDAEPDAIDALATEPEGEELSGEYQSMDKEGAEKGKIDRVPPDMRNELSPEREQSIEGVIRQRVEDMQQDARGHFKADEISLLSQALRKQLEGETVDTLFNYDRKNQSDYDALKNRVESRLGRNRKTADGETEETKMAREYPSMSKDSLKEFRAALGLPKE